MVTVADGRAVLGVTVDFIKQGLAKAEFAAEGTGEGGQRTVVDWILGTPNQKTATMDLLYQVNGYAAGVRAELSLSPDSEPIGDLRRRKVATALAQAEDAFRTAAMLSDDFVGRWLDAARAVVVGVAQGLEFVGKTVAQGVANLTSPLLMGVGAALVLYLVISHG